MITEDEPNERALVPSESRGLTKRSSVLVRRALDSPLLQKAMSNSIGMEFVFIPPGSFDMGSNNGEADEKPVHRVTIGQGFFMGKYEVTQGQWQALMGNNPSHFKGDENLPVEQVSWDDAQKFINKLNELNDGDEYRLPTEAEWEFACRAGATTEFAFGSSLSSDQANFIGDSPRSKAARLVYHPTTTPVGSFAPNAFGLFDMHGNVWEWCEDWYHWTYEGAPSDGSAWLSGGEQNRRVLRGGGWLGIAAQVRSAYRNGHSPDHSTNLFGFRLIAVVQTP
jgi:eukaryotic-like serine/threonine-protein kinase